MEDDDEIDAMLSQVDLSLLAVVKSHLETLVRVQLCSAQGVPRFSFVHLLPGMSRPFTSAPVYSMSLTYEERLRVRFANRAAAAKKAAEVPALRGDAQRV